MRNLITVLVFVFFLPYPSHAFGEDFGVVAEEIRCLVRYHGYRNSENYRSDMSGRWSRYIAVGKEDEPGTSLPLGIEDEYGDLAFDDLSYFEEELGLQFEVIFGNHRIPGDDDEDRIFGEFKLKISDDEDVSLAHADHLLKPLLMHTDNFVSQVTIKLPEDLIEEQLDKAEIDERSIYTHVKFQCN